MSKLPQFSRPTFETALSAWSKLLAENHYPTELVWIFDENLIFEQNAQGKSHLSFQTHLTPPPPEADRVAYNYFCEFEARIVFYRLGSTQGKSVCLMLCDSWFESKGEAEGFSRHDEWLMSFYPGAKTELEEIADEQRWKKRIVRNRPLHDLDFSMTLRGVHEILAHGRVLTSYEHYALRLLHGWGRLLGHQSK
ncbi:MAG: hypothetical protein H7Y43_15095 [Akkermansiaceae bacterium]|nr:hypothetical protein [Verrucomicrobiales bacterium]